MWIVVVILIALGLLVAVLKAFSRGAGGDEARQQGRDCGSCSVCNGQENACLQDRVMAKAAVEPEYFDDEELDVFKGRRSDGYTEEEVGQFAEVLYTMKPEEVGDWLASLSLRGVELPDQIKDEAIMLAGE